MSQFISAWKSIDSIGKLDFFMWGYFVFMVSFIMIGTIFDKLPCDDKPRSIIFQSVFQSVFLAVSVGAFLLTGRQYGFF